MASDNLQVDQLTGAENEKTNKINDIIQQLEDGLLELEAIAMADANRTITDAEFNRNVAFRFTGTLTANRDIRLPDTRRRFLIVQNNTTGGFSLVVRSTSGGATATVPNGEAQLIYYDGVDAASIAGGVGGGGGAGGTSRYDPLIAPVTGNTLDDEFDAALDTSTKWTVFDPGTALATSPPQTAQDPKRLVLDLNEDPSFAGILQPRIPADGDFAVYAYLDLQARTGDADSADVWGGIAIFEDKDLPATSNFVLVGLHIDKATTGEADAVSIEIGAWEFLQHDTASPTAFVTHTLADFTIPGIFLRIRVDADSGAGDAQLLCDYSFDGVSWLQFAEVDVDGVDAAMSDYDAVGLVASRRDNLLNDALFRFFRVSETNPLNLDEVTPAGNVGGAPDQTTPRFSVDTGPETVATEDDEFSDGSLDGKWTQWDVGTGSTFSEKALGYLQIVAGNTANFVGLHQAIPSAGAGGEWTVVCKVAALARLLNLNDEVIVGLLVAEDISGSPSTADFACIGLRLQRQTDGGVTVESRTFLNSSDAWTAGTGAGESYTADSLQTAMYFRARNEGSLTKFSLEASTDGLGWVQLAEILHSAITPVRIGFFVRKPSGSTTAVRCEWFRTTASSTREQDVAGRRIASIPA